MRILSMDHIVLTAFDLKRSVDFYRFLGFEVREFQEGRLALHFGDQKINLHQAGAEFSPHASAPTVGSLDLCFLIEGEFDCSLPIEEGPVRRTGATGPIESVYIRDPDGNLLEFAKPILPPVF